MAVKFKELIEEKSGGNITVTIYPNNQLGSEIETVQSAIAGMGDCDIVLTGESMQTYVEELGIIGMPYAITSDEHMEAVLNGEVGEELDQLMIAPDSGTWAQCGAVPVTLPLIKRFTPPMTFRALSSVRRNPA